MSTYGPKITVRGWPYNGDKGEFLWRSSYTQKPVGRIPLPYRSSHTLRVAQTGANYLSALTSEAEAITLQEKPLLYQKFVDAANNKALAKLKANIAEFSQQGENLGQASKSLAMVTDRVSQVFRSYKALRKGRFGEFMEVLRIPAQAKDRRYQTYTPKRISRDSSSIFLEYWYGWKPLIQDIFVGLNAVVDAPQNEKRPIKGRGTSGAFPIDKQGAPHRYISGSGIYSVDLRVIITVENENVFTLNRTGLINPATIAWQLMPFSFIVDWFINVEEFVDSLSMFAGLRLDQPQTSMRSSATSVEAENGVSPPQRCTFESFGLRRELSLPSVTLLPKVAWDQPVSRCAVAVALLTGVLTGKHGNVRHISVDPD